MDRRAANDCAYALALLDTTPTISVASPSASRTLISPQIVADVTPTKTTENDGNRPVGCRRANKRKK